MNRRRKLLLLWYATGRGIKPVERTKSGNPIHITDALAKPVQALSIALEPIQDLHGYDNPWPSGGGKNKLPYPFKDTTKTVNDVIFTDNGNGQIKINGTASARAVFFIKDRASAYIPSGEYILTTGAAVQGVVLAVDAYNGNTWVRSLGTTAGSTMITIDYNGYDRVEIFFSVSQGTDVSSVVFSPMLRLSSVSDATWQPYSNECPITGHSSVNVIVSTSTNPLDGTITNIPLGQTVYGGTLDVLTGVLTVDRAMDTLNGTQTLYFNGQTSARAEFYFAPSSTKKPAAQAATQNEGIVSDIFKSQPFADAPYVATGRTANGNIYFTLPPEVNSTALANAWLSSNNANIVYELATPITIQLTPTQVELLQGENNIWSDGEMTLVYLADGNASEIEALNILLGGRYVNNHEADEPTDREALDIILGGNTR